MNLLIVESPAKAKTIEKYLGRDYKVLASYGHVRDLPKSKLGVEIEKNFEPQYLIPVKAKKVVKDLKEAVAKADTIYLATDYDREGEAIAWHVLSATGLDKEKKKAVKRITFTEITKPALVDAVKNPREIDLNLVDAQQARRVLDRLVGYKLSPFLWKKVLRGLSAGRVQSVALRLIVEREREIEKFNKDEYWSIEANLGKIQPFKAVLTEIDGKKLDKLAIKSEKEANKIVDDLKNSEYKVKSVETKDRKRSPAPPFTTSTLQQEAGRKLGFSAKQTMRLAQTLYEQGLITYMRTDSVNISPIAARAAQEALKNIYGANYALTEPRFFKGKAKGAQEAHEAIRPTEPNQEPTKLNLEGQNTRLYKLIWQRFLASQAPEALFEETSAKITTGKYLFNAAGSVIKFDGFLRIYEIEDENLNTQKLPKLAEGEIVELKNLEKNQHFTEPPARYSEGTLVKELEKRGIGRPSTYAPTISTIQDRGYVQKQEGRLAPLEIGVKVNDLLVEHFPEIVGYEFTSNLEEKFDEIAEGKVAWQPVIKDFYEPFAKHLEEKTETVQKTNMDEETSEICPECKSPIVIKYGRFGKFYACSKYPECKYTKPLVDANTQKQIDEAKDEKCEKCGKPMVMKQSRFGAFLACSGYPECRQTKSLAPAASVPCPNCGKKLLKRRSKRGKNFWGCEGYPECKTAFWNEPIDKKCPECGGLMSKDFKGKLSCQNCKSANSEGKNYSKKKSSKKAKK